MDDSHLRTLSLEAETERPLVFNRLVTLKFMKPVQKKLRFSGSKSRAIQPIESSINPLETEREELGPRESRPITPAIVNEEDSPVE